MDLAAPVRACTRARQDQAGARSTVTYSALTVVVRITGPHEIRTC